jgi:hypothetical protein
LHAIPLGRFTPVSHFSTVHRFVEAAGGTLELRVELPGTGPITLTGVGGDWLNRLKIGGYFIYHRNP